MAMIGDLANMILHGIWAAVPVAGAFVLAGSGLVALAGWHRRHDRPHLPDAGRDPMDMPRIRLSEAPLAAGTLDVTTELHAVVTKLAGVAGARFVTIDWAVTPELAVRADPRAFGEVMHDLLFHAIRQSIDGRVLLTAARHGERVRIAVSDDGAGVDRATQEAALRPAQSLAAMHGVAFEIDARSGQGTTVAMRLPAVATSSRGAPVRQAERLDVPARRVSAGSAAFR